MSPDIFFLRDPVKVIHIGCLEFCICIQVARIAKSLVIVINDNDVGIAWRCFFAAPEEYGGCNNLHYIKYHSIVNHRNCTLI